MDAAPVPKVCRFRPSPPPNDPVYSAVPDDGLCLNVFLLITDRPESQKVLLGRIDPKAGWERIGGMSRPRIEAMGARWMLPSRQLFLFESPDEAAVSIFRTQLGVEEIPWEGPTVTSEAWERPTPAGTGKHWDLSFLYRAVWPEGRPLASPPWRELAFHDTSLLDPAQVGRSHLDVLALAGYPTRA
jgi:hypothetical protein